MINGGRSHRDDVLCRATRLAILVLISRSKRTVGHNTAELASKLGVSQRSIQRDMLMVETIEKMVAALGY